MYIISHSQLPNTTAKAYCNDFVASKWLFSCNYLAKMWNTSEFDDSLIIKQFELRYCSRNCREPSINGYHFVSVNRWIALALLCWLHARCMLVPQPFYPILFTLIYLVWFDCGYCWYRITKFKPVYVKMIINSNQIVIGIYAVYGLVWFSIINSVVVKPK